MPQPLVERDPGAPAELSGCERHAEHRAACVSEPRRLEPGRVATARDGAAGLVQLEHARLRAGADVEGATIAPGGGEQRVDDVPDVDEVPRLATVAVDHRLVPARHPFEEDRHDAALEPRILARPVDVRKAEDDVPRAVDSVPAGQILLGAELRDPVRRHRRQACSLIGRTVALAVDRAAGGREDDLRAGQAGGLGNANRPDDVHLRVTVGLPDGGLHIGLRGEVEDDLRAVELDAVPDVALDEGRGGVQVRTLAGGEVVDDRHLVSARDEGIDEIRADESRASRHDCPHRRIVGIGMFITFEGPDFSGKSTQAALLVEWLRGEGHEVIATREPGGTPIGEAIRDVVLHGLEMGAWAEAALFASARAEHVERVIRPALERGAWVVCDRYVDSSLAYQGIGRGLGVDAVLALNNAVTGGLLPDRTFVLLLAADAAARRGGTELDRIEREDVAFRSVVAEGYRELAELFPERVVALNATRPIDEIAEVVRDQVQRNHG